MPADEQTEEPRQGQTVLDLAEIELRRYEARLGVWKVVLGTFVVGLAGVLIPGAISWTTVLFENRRSEAEFRLAQQAAHQQYIKDFFDTAVNQDIELRIRFANYFAHLSDPEQREDWSSYRKDLTNQRDERRTAINKLEARLVAIKKIPEDEVDVTELDRVIRELTWTYAEIGYVPLNRSVVAAISDKKERLYDETVAVVRRLAEQEGPINVESVDYLRFWELYRRELIGVESRSFAQKMITIGRALTDLSQSGAAPDNYLRALSGELAELATFELNADARDADIGASQTTLEQVRSR